jgi:hypothetical protein
MAVLLDGQALPGLDHRVTIAEQIERKDLSGETSASAGSHGGWKPAIVEVRLLVDMERPGDLAELRRLFHRADEASGAPAVWPITEPAAQAMGIHRVRFTDFFRVAPQERMRVWEVSLTLIEERSVPERAEERRPEPAAASPAAPPSLQTTAGQRAAAGEDGFIEQALAYLNGQAGKLFFDEEQSP